MQIDVHNSYTARGLNRYLTVGDFLGSNRGILCSRAAVVFRTASSRIGGPPAPSQTAAEPQQQINIERRCGAEQGDSPG
jgi:hypothetical protein